jgi:hypothetical protein
MCRYATAAALFLLLASIDVQLADAQYVCADPATPLPLLPWMDDGYFDLEEEWELECQYVAGDYAGYGNGDAGGYGYEYDACSGQEPSYAAVCCSCMSQMPSLSQLQSTLPAMCKVIVTQLLIPCVQYQIPVRHTESVLEPSSCVADNVHTRIYYENE